MEKFTSEARFRDAFSTEEKCLSWLFNNIYHDVKECPECNKPFKYYKVKKRKCYECSRCGNQIYPTKGTIFESSRKPLTLWFRLILMFHQNKRGINVAEVVDVLDVAPNTARRMSFKIRSLMKQNPEMFKLHLKDDSIAEIDEMFEGGRKALKKGDKDRRGIGQKKILMGVRIRRGMLSLHHIKKKTKKIMFPIIESHIPKGVRLYTDQYKVYEKLEKAGYSRHKMINRKGSKPFMRGIHTNSIESVWRVLRKYIVGTYWSVSSRHIQAYLDEFCFRFNRRGQRWKYVDDLLERIISFSSS